MRGELRGSRGEGEEAFVPRLCQPCANDAVSDSPSQTPHTSYFVPASSTSLGTAKMAVARGVVCLMLTLICGCQSRVDREFSLVSAAKDNRPLVTRFVDIAGDDGTNATVIVGTRVAESVTVAVSNREDGLYVPVGRFALVDGLAKVPLDDLSPGEAVWIAVEAGDQRNIEEFTPFRDPFDTNRTYLLFAGLLICGSILGFIYAARRGVPMWVRPIPALTAVDEAVGRATEMGKDVLFVPGIQDINDIQTIAGLTILGHVAERTADYRASLEVPTSKSLVMTAAAETVESAYLEAGRQDYFNAESVSYITDEQFGYVAYLSGYMVREKPAACFYLGAFFAESLILAETGNAVGAVQVAGTAQPSQLPFFVAACDYTLIGEEFFAASAYLSGDPDKLGSLKGQDVGKVFVGVAVLIGVGLLTVAAATGDASIAAAAEYWKSTILAGG